MNGDWWDRAACRAHPDLSWFPGSGESQREQVTICRTCPVRPECLFHALTEPEDFGVWGGYSDRERKRLRASHRQAS